MAAKPNRMGATALTEARRVAEPGETARRLCPLVHLLEGLARRSAGWLEHEPRLDRKVALAEHLADDADAARALRRRVAALDRGEPGDAPRGAAGLLDRLDACRGVAEHVEVAYGQIKPVMAAAATGYLHDADPLVEQPTVALLLRLRADQQRHLVQIAPRTDPPPDEALAALAGELAGGPREARLSAPVAPAEPPARDAFVVVVDERPSLDDIGDALHALLHAAVAAGERAARHHHETGDPEAAARAAVHLRHAAVADRLLAEEGVRWGERPVGPAHAEVLVLAQAVALQHPSTARAIGHLLADR